MWSLIGALSCILADRLEAQTFTNLHTFGPYINGVNTDGASPEGGLLLSSNTLYGTTYQGGIQNRGTVFKLNTDGSDFTLLHVFDADSSSNSANGFGYLTNPDGFSPRSELILSGNTLYGTATEGGELGWGTVFAVTTDGTNFTTLHSFTLEDSGPAAGLLLSGSTLFGVTEDGDGGVGNLYAISTNGTGYTDLHYFVEGEADSSAAQLIMSGNSLYGTSWRGGTSGEGDVFEIGTNGTAFTNLYSFPGGGAGCDPQAGLLLSDNILYGTAAAGGFGYDGLNFSGSGMVFAVNIDGTGFQVLHSFAAPYDLNDYGFPVNSDGAEPESSLVLSGNSLYGTTYNGGVTGYGTVFEVNIDGTDFTNLHTFSTLDPNNLTNSDGACPIGGLILTGNTLYGTAQLGGAYRAGTVFSLSLPGQPQLVPPQLAIMLSVSNVVLTWTNTATGFELKSTTTLASPAGWSANSPAPVVVNGQFTVTNPVSSATMFYRLSQ
jgi:uncharacterized repeat protein (TIGR03803 family)